MSTPTVPGALTLEGIEIDYILSGLPEQARQDILRLVYRRADEAHRGTNKPPFRSRRAQPPAHGATGVIDLATWRASRGLPGPGGERRR